MELSQLWIYPIKSCQGFRADAALLEDHGLQWDRRWLLLDEDGAFMTARRHPSMLHIAPRIHGETLEISAPAMPALQLPLQPEPGALQHVKVWKRECPAWSVPEASSWFREALGLACQLVALPPQQPSPLRPDFASIGQGVVSYADAFPCLLLSLASLEQLNRRLLDEDPRAPTMEIERFRPNLVVDGCPPHDEDLWLDFTIGACDFAGVKLCDRCSLTTIHPQTLEKSTQPLAILQGYRRHENRVYFGQNAIPTSTGTLAVGDPITVHQRGALLSF